MKSRHRKRSRSCKQIRREILAVVWVAASISSLLLVGRELLTSTRFAVANVRIEGARRASVDELLALGGVRMGSNVFELDVSEIRRRLLAHPWVRDAEVRRDLPRELEVSVTEHQPRLLVALGELYLADEAGAIIKSYEPGDPWSLPVVTGLERESIERDRAILRPALELVEAWSRHELPELSEVRFEGASGLAARTSDGREVVLGRGAFEPKLDRLEHILASARTRDALTIRLDGERRENRATVVFARTAAEGGR